MLLWEMLATSTREQVTNGSNGQANGPAVARTKRLPFDKRCAARTKTGSRCKGRIYRGPEFCFFHDPETADRRHKRGTSKAAKKRRRLMHLPDGYLRKLKSIAAIGDAMDRLYREVRRGVVMPEMGQVLLCILARLQDSNLVTIGPRPDRTKAARVRPKLKALLTRQERAAWNRAVDHALSRSTIVDAKSRRCALSGPVEGHHSVEQESDRTGAGEAPVLDKTVA